MYYKRFSLLQNPISLSSEPFGYPLYSNFTFKLAQMDLNFNLKEPIIPSTELFSRSKTGYFRIKPSIVAMLL